MKLDVFELLTRAYSYNGKPYLWGAKGPEAFDCSGFVTHVIHELGGPDWRQTQNAQGLFRGGILEPFLPDLERGFPLSIPAPVALALVIPPGTLAFYGSPARVEHVVLTCGDGRVFGACGGDSHTTVPTPGAQVQFKPSVCYRPGLRGFRKLPEVAT